VLVVCCVLRIAWCVVWCGGGVVWCVCAHLVLQSDIVRWRVGFQITKLLSNPVIFPSCCNCCCCLLLPVAMLLLALALALALALLALPHYLAVLASGSPIVSLCLGMSHRPQRGALAVAGWGVHWDCVAAGDITPFHECSIRE
jgi:hypothetical protein